jgi:hypothetical protein
VADVSLRQLVPAEEEWLAAELSAGRRPTVHLRAATADLDAGARGRLVAADAPRAGEYLVVEVRGDRLPFSATELALPPTVAKRVRKAAGIIDPPKARRTAAKAAPAATRPGTGRPRKAAQATPAKATPAKATSAKATSAKAAAVQTGAAKTTTPTKAPTATATPAKGRVKTAPARVAAPRQAARRKPPAPVALSLVFDGARWTVEARSGSRRVRPVEVPAAAAAAATTALGVPDALALVSAVTDAMRLEAEQRAATLREQLAAAEAELAHFTGR